VDEGLQCDARSQTCQPLVAVGGECEYLGCVAGAYCSSVGVCSAPKADGLPCNGNYECASKRCIFEDDATNGKCGQRPIANPETCSGNSL